MIDLQNNKILKEKYNNVKLSIFYSKYIDTIGGNRGGLEGTKPTPRNVKYRF
jgi:hypothetical protein